MLPSRSGRNRLIKSKPKAFSKSEVESEWIKLTTKPNCKTGPRKFRKALCIYPPELQSVRRLVFGTVPPAPASLALCPILSMWDCLRYISAFIHSSFIYLIFHPCSDHSYQQTQLQSDNKMSQGNQTVHNLNVQQMTKTHFDYLCSPVICVFPSLSVTYFPL